MTDRKKVELELWAEEDGKTIYVMAGIPGVKPFALLAVDRSIIDRASEYVGLFHQDNDPEPAGVVEIAPKLEPAP